MRLLGDRVLQANAWRIADELGWTDTYTAEYIAVTQLQADAFVTLDPRLAEAVQGLVRVAPLDELSERHAGAASDSVTARSHPSRHVHAHPSR